MLTKQELLDLDIRPGYTITVPSTVGYWHATVIRVDYDPRMTLVDYFLPGDDAEYSIDVNAIGEVIGPAYDEEEYDAEGNFTGTL